MPRSEIKINRCICFDRTFAEMKEVAEAHSAVSVKALQQHIQFGQQCELCHPYVRRMLRTGETSFGHVVSESDEPV